MSLYLALEIVQSVVGLVSRRIATKLGRRVLASDRLKARILAGLMKEPDDWISQEYAVMMVSSVGVADEETDELVREFHMNYPDWNAPPDQAGRYIARVEQEMPRAVLQEFFNEHEWAYKDGRYQRSVLLLWLRSQAP